MRVPPLLILLPAFTLVACGKKDLEAESEAIPVPEPAPAPAVPTPALPQPGAHPFRVPDATSKLPTTDDTRSALGTTDGAPGLANDSATVTVRPPDPAPPTGSNE